MKAFFTSTALALIVAPATAQQVGFGGSISAAAGPSAPANISLSGPNSIDAPLSQAGAVGRHAATNLGRSADLSGTTVATNADTTIDRARMRARDDRPAARPVQGPALDGSASASLSAGH